MNVHIKNLFHKDAVGIWLFEQRGNEKFVAAPAKLVYLPVLKRLETPEPTFEIPYYQQQELFQSLINALIEQGLRPDNDKVAGLLEAQTKHLEDMRKLVFK